MAPRHGKKAKKLSIVELLDANSDEVNLIHPNSKTSLDSDNKEQDKLSSDSKDNKEDDKEEGEVRVRVKKRMALLLCPVPHQQEMKTNMQK
jgi:hypothetical protein